MHCTVRSHCHYAFIAPHGLIVTETDSGDTKLRSHGRQAFGQEGRQGAPASLTLCHIERIGDTYQGHEILQTASKQAFGLEGGRQGAPVSPLT